MFLFGMEERELVLLQKDGFQERKVIWNHLKCILHERIQCQIKILTYYHQKNPSLPPHLEKYPPGYKSLYNDAHEPNSTEDYPNDSTDNSFNEKEDSVNNLKETNNEDNDDKYKDENYQALNSNEIVIKNIEE